MLAHTRGARAPARDGARARAARASAEFLQFFIFFFFFILQFFWGANFIKQTPLSEQCRPSLCN